MRWKPNPMFIACREVTSIAAGFRVRSSLLQQPVARPPTRLC